jgi:hypothetical protein
VRLEAALAPELVDALEELIAERASELAVARPRFLSKTALAAHYGVSPRTIRTWRERGLPGVRVGREVMFPVDDCDEWIEGR